LACEIVPCDGVSDLQLRRIVHFMESLGIASFSGLGWLILLLIAVLIAIFVILQRRPRVESANIPVRLTGRALVKHGVDEKVER